MTIDQYGLHLTKKEASISVTILTILTLLIFLSGYFWGKKSTLEGFAQKASQDSLNDHVDYMLTMQSFAAKNGTSIEELGLTDRTESSDQNSLEQNLPDALEEQDLQSELIKVAEKTTESHIKTINAKLSDKSVKSIQHYALLAGFGKKSLAQQMVNRLQKRNISVRLKTRVSKSASGRSSKTWYQVITNQYDTVAEVQDLIDRILKSEKIKHSDIKII